MTWFFICFVCLWSSNDFFLKMIWLLKEKKEGGENIARSHQNLVLQQTLSIDHDNILVVIQLIACQLLIVFNRGCKITINGWCDCCFDVDIRQALTENSAVGAVIRRLVAFELLAQMWEVMRWWLWIDTTLLIDVHLLIVHLLMYWRNCVRNCKSNCWCQTRCNVVQHNLLVSWCWYYWLRLLIILCVGCQFLVQQWCQCWWRW